MKGWVLYIFFLVAIETVEVLVSANAVLVYGPLKWSFSTLLEHQGLLRALHCASFSPDGHKSIRTCLIRKK